MQESQKRQVVNTEGVVGVLHGPAAHGPHPAVLVLGGSEGRVPERAAATLAREGFVAMAVAYFGVPPLSAHLVEVPLEYLAGVVGWLRRRGDVDGERIVVLGRSRGGELALLLASTFPDSIRAVVAYAPSSVVWQAAPPAPRSSNTGPRSSWTLYGEPLPFVPVAGPSPAEVARLVRGEPISFRPSFERGLHQAALDGATLAAATIAVERISGAVLLVSGDADLLWPSTLQSEMIISRLAEHAHPFPARHLHYEDAGHLVGVPGTRELAASATPFLMGGSPGSDEAASRDSWPIALSFLRTEPGQSSVR